MSDSTVLVVEDERTLADMYATWLSQAGYTTRVAYTGQKALDLLGPELDVALLDRRLPKLTGDDILDEIREAGYDCRAAMVTAVTPESDIVDLSFDQYLTKPVKEEDIVGLVEELSAASGGQATEIMDALGDAKTRQCFQLLTDDSHSAKELATETGYSLPTVYRRLNSLKQTDLIESRTELDPGGDHYETYRATVEEIRLDFSDGTAVTTDGERESV